MKNSLIIKSGDINFENYYKSMIKRKMATALQSQMLNHTQSSGKFQQDITSPRSGTVLFVKGKRPPARDGHSAVIINE